ncbi:MULTISPECIES: phage replisome organizer N-terminal domain-containing protein [Streptococcus]|uniref:phage replisome organizer N-terminal domain-containing protein n=1 Tax=Streptococcus TaxID=1301 RepID=UPI00076FD172|nr:MULTISPECIES: phage replisome organizer N-terminal domain-containing protein [Streptococcus]KXI11961.1 phage replisome organizer protein [Streptococcus pasteurianus]MDU7847469.1 phage replisome organizer N-terminal domain-containing protein [Streptococcus sp.]DAM71770.1 MAG TPA: replisome organizer protein [Bacteriophage sp.]
MAKTNRRYYWIQLAQDFFKSKEMKLLRKMPGGDTYTIIYLKLMLISLEDSGKIYFEELAQDLAEEMALLIDEDTEAVRMTLMFLSKKGLLTRHSDYEFFLEQVPEMIGSETASARRVRKHREQKALQSNNDVTKRNGDIEKEIEIKKDINIDIKSEVDKKQTAADEKSEFNIFEYYQSRIGVLDGYQSQKLNDYIYIDNLSLELVKRAIDRAADNSKRNFGYVNSILKNWAQNGIKTIVQQDEEQRNFDVKKAQRTYSNQQLPKSNVPEWVEADYKHEATAEEQAKLDELKKSLMED